MPIALSDDQRLDWLRLIRTESVGPRSFRALINRFGGAGAALEALPEVSRAAGRPVRPMPLAEAERELRQTERLGARLIALGEADYPQALQAIDSAPPLITVRGRIEVLRRPAVAIVGSRNASALGMKFAARLGSVLADAGYLVVSGLARGIDTAAHEASLGMGTAAVFAGGVDHIYPPQNEALLQRLIETGVAISEMPLGWQPRARDFPRRNRIVSGMALGVVVVEAARGSGSLITARFALEQGREVFAVPGSPLDPRATGTNDLIRQGATLCADPAHVIEALQPQLDLGERFPDMRDPLAIRAGEEELWDELPLPELAGHAPPRMNPSPTEAPEGDLVSGASVYRAQERGEGAVLSLRTRLMDLTGPTPVSIDDLIRLSGGSASEVQRLLLDLELEAIVTRHSGQRVSRPG